MSFDVSAYQAGASPEEEAVFREPLGSQGTVRRQWAEAAEELDLKILKRLSEGELIVAHDQLEAFSAELGVLARHWVAAVPDAVVTTSIGERRFETPLLVHLLHRMALVRAAVRIAEVVKGRLEIT